MSDDRTTIACFNCHRKYSTTRYNSCPNCGHPWGGR